MMRRTLPLAAAALFAACGRTEVHESVQAAAPAQPAELLVTAQDYSYTMPDTVAPGVTTIRLRNTGKEPHQIQMFRLDSGKTMQDVMMLMQQDAPAPAWLVGVGGPNATMPGEETSATVQLSAGHYLGVCFIPSPDGAPHVAKGMMHELVVTGTPGTAAMPAGDITVKLVDYGFQPSGTFTAGHHTIRVINAGQQDHELVLLKLLPGKTPADLKAWADGGMNTMPPFTARGGMGTIPVGSEADFDANLDAGNYVLICFVPDTKDGKMHVDHGMVQPFTVE